MLFLSRNLSVTRFFRSCQIGAFGVIALFFCLGISSSCTVKSKKMFPGPVYVTLQSSGVVESLPSGDTLSGLTGAHYDAISPDGSRLLVSNQTQPEAYLIDTHSDKKLATFKIGWIPQGVAISPDGKWGFAVGAGNGTVTVIDMKKEKVVKSIVIGKTPHNVRFTTDSKLAYITLQGAGAVAVVDMQTLEKINEFPVQGIAHPHNLDLSADGKILWIRGLTSKVAAVDLKSHKVLAIIPVGLGHAGIDVVPGGRYVFTGAIADTVVDVIDPKTYKVIKRIDVGQGPHGVRASRDGRWVYVAVTSSNKVAVIDTRTLQVVKQIPTHGKQPFWLTVVGND